MPTPAVENYVKEIFLAQQRLAEGESVAMGAVAKALDVTPGTATAMLKSLAQNGMADYEPRHGARLTEKGRALALRMIRKHRIVEVFLVQELGLDWSEVHIEAERLEHAISENVLDHMDAKVGHPTTDPHGEPIPSAHGDLAVPSTTSLALCDCGREYVIAKVVDQSVDFLHFLNERGLKPGSRVTVATRNEVADVVEISIDGRNVTMGIKAAEKIFVGI